MLGPTTPNSNRHRDLPPAPPFLVLQPAHLRFYGIDTDLSTPSQRQRTNRSNTPANSERPPALTSVAVGSATEPEHDADNSRVRSTVDSNAGTSRARLSSADALTRQRHSPPERTRTEARQESTGNPGLSGRAPSWPRWNKQLPLSPPPLSARCQLHPTVMRDLGLRAGDPALVLALARGWISDGAAAFAAGPSRSSADAVGGVQRQDQEARDAFGGFPVATQGDEKQEAEGRITAVGVDEAEEGLEACRGGVESLGLEAHAGGEQPGHRGRGAEAQAQQQKQQPHEEHRPAQPRDSERRRVAASLLDGVAGKLRCFLCTAWTNPHLAPEEAAVDGRVSVPLCSTTISTAAEAALGCLLDVSQPPPEETAGGSERPKDDRSLRPTDTAAPASDDIVARFLSSAVDRHVSAPAADSEGSGSGDGESVISIVPVNALCDGAYGVPDIGGGRAGRGGDTPPVAVRVSARIVAARGRRYGDMPAVGGVRVAAEDVGRAADTGRGGNWGDGSAKWPPAGGKQAKQQQQQQQRYLPPAYTSLVKRSLRHLVVSNGCEVAVPSCPNRTDAMLEGSSSAASTHGTNGRRLPNGDGTSPVRIEISGGSGDLDGGGGALAALFGGAVCAVGPESLILVEDLQGTVDGAAGSSDAEADLRRGKGGAAEGGGTRREGQRPQVGNHRYEPKTSKLTPMDALVELMLLPMTAKPVLPAQGLKPLEFSLPRGVLLTGPPGVGKTFAVRSAVESVRNFGSSRDGAGDGPFQVKLTTLNGAEILSLGQWEACQALREAFSTAENWSKGHDTDGRDSTKDANHHPQRTGKSSGSRCAVIFLDEADALLARRDRDGDKAGGGEGFRALAQLLTLMDGFHGAGGSSHVIVVGATNRPGALDPALRRPGRFDQELALAPPDVQGRADILRHHLRGVKVVGGKATIDAVALSCVGFVGADLAALAREAALLAARGQVFPQGHLHGNDQALTAAAAAAATPMEATVGAAHLSAAMEKVGASSLRGHQVTVPRTPWSDIGGMEEAKAKLRQAVEWPVANKAAFDRMGLTPPRGILLFGPPGCSKTTLVRAAATAAGATFVCLSGADVFSPYLGEAEAAVRQAFRIARNAAPALLFFDELDAIVCKRGGVGDKGSANSAESRVLATFLTEMDGVGSLRGDGVVVVGATNRPEAVDRALLRPGRFDQVVYAPLPEEDARRQIFEVHSKKMAVDREGVDFRTLASVSKGLTGAEIEGVCREAAMSAIREEGFGSDGDTRADWTTTAAPATAEASATNAAGADIRANIGGSSSSSSSAIETLFGDHGKVSNTQEVGPKPEEEEEKAEWHDDEAGGRGAAQKMTEDGENKKERGAKRGATVTMRHLLAAASAAAARPGVTREMIEAYDRFAAGL